MEKIFYMVMSICELALGITIFHKIYPDCHLKNNRMKVLAVILLGPIGFTYVWNNWLFFISTSMCIVIGIWLATLYKVLWKMKFWNILFCWSFYYIGVSICKLPLLMVQAIIEKKNIFQVNTDPKTYIETIWMCVIITMVYIVIKYYKRISFVLKKLFLEKLGFCIVIVMVEWALLCVCMEIGGSGYEIKDLLLNIVLIMCVALMLICITLFFTYQQVKNESLLQQELHGYSKKQYQEMKELYENNSRWVHDVKHELVFVETCLEENNLSGARESIQGYLQNIKKREKKVWSGFAFLDFMLNYKKAEMDKKNIKFMLDIEVQQINLSEEDFVIMLGNLLDNAIEAVSKCEEDKRYINLKIHNLNELLLLDIENSSTEIPKIKKNAFVSSKNEQGLHGWGLKSVKQIVESNHGEIQFQYNEELFKVKILI